MASVWDRYPDLRVDFGFEPKKVVKIWDSRRSIRKAVMVRTYEELHLKGREKMGIPPTEPVNFVLDDDGTEVEDTEFFRSLPDNSVLLLLRRGERWQPAKLDILRAAITTLPALICETIESLELERQIPTWKIVDNKGRVTVVLHWEYGGFHPTRVRMHMQTAPTRRHQRSYIPPEPRSETTITPSGKKETLINEIYPPPPRYSNNPQITVDDHDDMHDDTHNAAATYEALYRMPHSNSGLSSSIHIHTYQCGANPHNPAEQGSGMENNGIICDFHCCSLHEEGRPIVADGPVPKSPIQEPKRRTNPLPSALSDGKKSGVKQRVRFLDLEGGGTVRPGESDGSSDSDSDSTGDEDCVKTKKYLLLVDRPTRDRKERLSIKDIGAILERLSSTIVDVEKLNREIGKEGNRYWIMKATIRGMELNDLGLVYNGYYYVVGEHPDYKDESEDDQKFLKESSGEDRI